MVKIQYINVWDTPKALFRRKSTVQMLKSKRKIGLKAIT